MLLNAELYIVLETALAMVLGGIVGYERERANKPAGLRTHMLLAGAAALLVGLGDALLMSVERFGYQVRADPFGIVQATVTGIGILGAGTIFRRSSDHVEGLTTAASLFFVGAIGIAVAVQQYVVAVTTAVLVLIALRSTTLLERGREKGGADEGSRGAHVADK